jgi:hypothetical protein
LVAAGGLGDVPARARAWACDAGVVDGESGGWHGLPNSPLASLMAGAPADVAAMNSEIARQVAAGSSSCGK